MINRSGKTMGTQLKHWIVVLERIKTELLWKPYENDAVKRIKELIKEMEQAGEEMEEKNYEMGNYKRQK
jgi:hypothetical protein